MRKSLNSKKKSAKKSPRKGIKKPKKAKIPPIDGLSEKDIKKIRGAIRMVWHWSYPKKLVIARCTGPDGFPRCEKCRAKAPKIFVDHIHKVGDVDGGYIARLFVPSRKLQGLCKKCHDAKTKLERQGADTNCDFY